eukprot:3538887-Amphidinium_carterae.1
MSRQQPAAATEHCQNKPTGLLVRRHTHDMLASQNITGRVRKCHGHQHIATNCMPSRQCWEARTKFCFRHRCGWKDGNAKLVATWIYLGQG